MSFLAENALADLCFLIFIAAVVAACGGLRRGLTDGDRRMIAEAGSEVIEIWRIRPVLRMLLSMRTHLL